MRRVLPLFLVLMCFVAIAPLGAQAPTIGQIVDGDADFDLFAAAAEAGGLLDDLSAPQRTYTLFAPTDAALTALLDRLGLTPEQLLGDRALVRRIVQYHIIGEEVTLGNALLDGTPQQFFTFSNDALTFAFEDGRIVLNNGQAFVTSANNFAGNGVIHVVNGVLLPPGIDVQLPEPLLSVGPDGLVTGTEADPDAETADAGVVIPPNSALGVASNVPSLSIFTAAVQAAGLTDAIANGGPYTIFAPTDGAFGTLLGELGVSQSTLLADTNLLTSVLSYHVSPRTYSAAELLGIGSGAGGPVINGVQLPGGGSFQEVPTLITGNHLPVSVNNNRIVLDNGRAAVITGDIQSSNAVIHLIDNVLLP